MNSQTVQESVEMQVSQQTECNVVREKTTKELVANLIENTEYYIMLKKKLEMKISDEMVKVVDSREIVEEIQALSNENQLETFKFEKTIDQLLSMYSNLEKFIVDDNDEYETELQKYALQNDVFSEELRVIEEKFKEFPLIIHNLNAKINAQNQELDQLNDDYQQMNEKLSSDLLKINQEYDEILQKQIEAEGNLQSLASKETMDTELKQIVNNYLEIQQKVEDGLKIIGTLEYTNLDNSIKELNDHLIDLQNQEQALKEEYEHEDHNFSEKLGEIDLLISARKIIFEELKAIDIEEIKNIVISEENNEDQKTTIETLKNIVSKMENEEMGQYQKETEELKMRILQIEMKMDIYKEREQFLNEKFSDSSASMEYQRSLQERIDDLDSKITEANKKELLEQKQLEFQKSKEIITEEISTIQKALEAALQEFESAKIKNTEELEKTRSVYQSKCDSLKQQTVEALEHLTKLRIPQIEANLKLKALKKCLKRQSQNPQNDSF